MQMGGQLWEWGENCGGYDHDDPLNEMPGDKLSPEFKKKKADALVLSLISPSSSSSSSAFFDPMSILRLSLPSKGANSRAGQKYPPFIR